MHWRDEKFIEVVSQKTAEKRRDVGIRGRIILKLILEGCEVVSCSHLVHGRFIGRPL
jgi:hypothetical protein